MPSARTPPQQNAVSQTLQVLKTAPEYHDEYEEHPAFRKCVLLRHLLHILLFIPIALESGSFARCFVIVEETHLHNPSCPSLTVQ